MAVNTDASTEAGASVPAPPRENIVRAMMPGLEFRDTGTDGAPDDGRLGTLTGHFAVFNTVTEINSIWEGNFLERIAPGAFKKTISENRDSMKVLYDHGHDPQLGNKPLGPIEDLREDATGGYYEVSLLDTSYNRDLLPGLKNGLYGASFRFKVIREDINEDPGVSKDNPRGLPMRTIREAQVMEFGPVTFPAYAEATAGVRSMTDDYIFERFLSQPDRLRALLAHFTSTPEAVIEEDGPTENAPTEDRAEPEAHPVDVRRDSRHLFGTEKEEAPSWRL